MNSVQLVSLCSVLFGGLFLFSSVRGGLVEVTQCEDGTEMPKKVYISNCLVAPCEFTIGTNVEVNMTFMVPEDYEKIYARASARLGEANIPYPLPQANACESLINNRCPLEAGEIVTYQLIMPILTEFPPLDYIEITFKMVDKTILNPVSFMCFVVPARIVVP